MGQVGAVVNLRRVMAAGGLALLAGCGPRMKVADPVGWWHGLEGGRIAQDRPPPPGVHDPFPNLAQVPAKPPSVIAKPDRDREAAALIAQRDQADATAAADLLPGTGAAPPAHPSKAVAPDPNASTGSFEAASAPAQTGAKPTPDALPHLVSATVSGGVQTNASLPALPDAPPAPPSLPGMPALIPAKAAPPPASSASKNTLTIAFDPGSDQLPVSALPALRATLARRAGKPLLVTGHGEAAPGDPLQQDAALLLAMRRAEAIGAALRTAGLPPAALRLAGEAAGRGASLRLLD